MPHPAHLANDPKGSKDERHIHIEQKLHQSFDKCHHTVLLLVLLDSLENQVEVQSLLGRTCKAGIEK